MWCINTGVVLNTWLKDGIWRGDHNKNYTTSRSFRIEVLTSFISWKIKNKINNEKSTVRKKKISQRFEIYQFPEFTKWVSNMQDVIKNEPGYVNDLAGI